MTALAGVVAPGLALNCNVRLSQGLGQNIVAARTQFVEAQRTVLAGQGFTSVSDQALSAFFFSALYEELRFESTLFNERESPLLAPGGRRPRPKRRGAAYFTPPSLAYLAAHRALGAYFDGGAHDRLPKIFDPAMGTGLYLVAALDYLDSLDTLPVPLPAAAGDASRRAALALECLYGADFDAITCGAAKLCLAIAAGELEAVQNNISWEDSTVLSDGNAGKFD
ncbi:MAG: N-6 DNA methylase, partial [Cyanobacteria bacterium SZAS LIN-2]|nr:N-6 DNA methylase [Cyanobacteria bacterium SZAS LIN-2]